MATIQMEPKSAVPDLMLSQTRVIRAPRARVYEAWTDPQILMQWFGPAGAHAVATMDVRVGGEYRIDIVPDAPPADAGSTHECGKSSSTAVGHFVQLIPDELIQFSWIPSWYPEEKSIVTVTLKDVAAGTELTLVHERFLTEASRDNHKNGWAGTFEKLAALLEA